MLAVPERFAPFFKHRSISTNSTGAVETHLADADASPDQKLPFYTAASFVLIRVPLLRGLAVVLSPPYIQDPTLPKLSEKLVIISLDPPSDNRTFSTLDTNAIRLRLVEDADDRFALLRRVKV